MGLMESEYVRPTVTAPAQEPAEQDTFIEVAGYFTPKAGSSIQRAGYSALYRRGPDGKWHVDGRIDRLEAISWAQVIKPRGHAVEHIVTVIAVPAVPEAKAA